MENYYELSNEYVVDDQYDGITIVTIDAWPKNEEEKNFVAAELLLDNDNQANSMILFYESWAENDSGVMDKIKESYSLYNFHVPFDEIKKHSVKWNTDMSPYTMDVKSFTGDTDFSAKYYAYGSTSFDNILRLILRRGITADDFLVEYITDKMGCSLYEKELVETVLEYKLKRAQ